MNSRTLAAGACQWMFWKTFRASASLNAIAGAMPVFIVTPVYPRLPSQVSGPPPSLLLAYINPIFCSDLSGSGARIDEAHLNLTGSEKFTRLLGEDFLRNTRQP